jgi:hypothetical protein
MDSGQEKFYHFIMGRVATGNESAAKTLLEESFGRQTDGTFDKAYIDTFNFKLLPLLRPDAVEEVTAILTNFGAEMAQD